MISLREETLAMTVWSMYQILGFDTDGDFTPDAMISGMGLDGFCQAMIGAAEQTRADYDEALRDDAAIRADERRRVLDEVTAMVRQQITDWYPAGHVALDAVVRELIDMRGDDARD